MGATSAIIGAILDFLLAQRRHPDANRLPGCMILLSGALGVAGIVSLLAGLLLGVFGRALLMGVGVSSGFLLGFLVMTAMWFMVVRR